jgi:molybdopterin synthase catalytic subunit
MNVRVRLFARQREIVGRRELVLELEDPATIGDAWRALVAAYPDLAPATPSVRFARNGEYAWTGEGLAEGDELACIPPVAGGAADAGDGGAPGAAAAPGAPALVRIIELTADPIDDARLASMRGSVARSVDGAIVSFVGVTRETPGTPAPGEELEATRHAGDRVLALEYEGYEAMARAVIGTIADEIAARFGVTRVAIVHRTGTVAVGETSVAIVVAAPHRDPAFDACRYAIEELKARAPIWKSERFADGSVWIGAPARSGPHTTAQEPGRAQDPPPPPRQGDGGE